MKKVYFYTFGCKVNQYDTQRIRENFSSDYNEVASPEDADIVVINSCTVTAEADRQCRQIVRRMTRVAPQADIVVCGCYSKRATDEIKNHFDGNPRVKILKDMENIIEYYKIVESKKIITSFSEHARAYLKIQDGCDQFCSYCVVPYIRSGNCSKSKDEVVEEVTALLNNGYLEIVLCGVRLGKYSPQENYLLENLISDILSINKEFRIRLSSIEITEITDKLLNFMKENPIKICPHLHIPLQSGDDTLLKKMNRPYNTRFYSERISDIKKTIPDITITTDVIVGFPGETEEMFENTCEFVEKIGFSKVHIFPFSPRPGTSASIGFKSDDNYVKTVKLRKKKLFEIDESLRKKARKISENSEHHAVYIGDGWILTEDYQYFRCNNSAKDKIFRFRPEDISLQHKVV